MPSVHDAQTATNAETRAAGSKLTGFIQGVGGVLVDKLFDLAHFVLKDANGNVGLGGNPACALDIFRADQSVSRIRLRNGAVGGEIWDMVAGVHNISQNSLSFFNVGNDFTPLILTSGEVQVKSADNAEGGLKLSKKSGVSPGARADWSISHRDNNRDLLFYGYDGATFKNFLWFSWPNDRVEAHRNLTPGGDNALTCGAGSLRWSVVYAASGTINTSDAREKTWRGAASFAELEAAKRIIAELGFYQWNDALAEKGVEGARYHYGVRAQSVWSIMADEGLIDEIEEGVTPHSSYAFLCYDEWDAVAPVEESRDEDGKILVFASEGREAGNRFGIRVDQLILFLLAAQDARLAALEAAA